MSNATDDDNSVHERLSEHLETSTFNGDVQFSTGEDTVYLDFGNLRMELESLREEPAISLKGDTMICTGTVVRFHRDDELIETHDPAEPINFKITSPELADAIGQSN